MNMYVFVVVVVIIFVVSVRIYDQYMSCAQSTFDTMAGLGEGATSFSLC